MCLALVFFALDATVAVNNVPVKLIPIESLVHKEKTPNRLNMDLYYIRQGSFLYIYDKLDPSGTSINNLFAGKFYELASLDNRCCIVVRSAERITHDFQIHVDFARITAIPRISGQVEANCSIWSNRRPITKTGGRAHATYWIHPYN